jgi:hypothetical protein
MIGPWQPVGLRETPRHERSGASRSPWYCPWVPHAPRHTLAVPTLLAVTIIAAPACPGDDKTTETEARTESTASDTAGPTTSGTDTGDTAGLDCAEIDADMTTCQATTGCAWDPVLMSCVVDCYMLFDEASCVATNYCEWYGGSCHSPL